MNNEVLTTEQMGAADRLTMTGGTSGLTLMKAAGLACADLVLARFSQQKILVLCGPGNNGGDGFVIANKLEAEGRTVTVALAGTPNRLTGDAQLAYEEWILAAKAPVLASFDETALAGADLVVDGVFGSGLARDVETPLSGIIEAVIQKGLPVVSIDVPTGIKGDDGQVCGSAFSAALTVTFFRKKPAHLLFPGRAYCGEVVVADIGISDKVLESLAPKHFENDPSLWLARFPWPGQQAHKYSRGHTVVVAGGTATSGAARLAARAALRVGAGLVSALCPSSAVLVNASHLTAIMVRGFGDQEAFAARVGDTRLNAFVIGPGGGVGEGTRARALHLLSLGRAIVLDADALTSFEEAPGELMAALHGQAVLTPHAGEFARLFPDLADLPKLEAASKAAARSGAVVVLKGPDTVIAHPATGDGAGFIAINANAPATLATAGSGDVLAGLIASLMGQGMDAFDASCAGVWIHGHAACLFGPGLISEDLPDLVPKVLQHLASLSESNME